MTENPQYDVDPKWAELVKERGNLSHDLQKRLPSLDRKKGPGRPPILASPPSSQAMSINSAASSLPTSLASNLQFSSLASAAGLGAISPSLLSSLSMSNFDPKTNPLLLPFASVPNMNAFGGMGQLSSMNFFANLASLGMSGLTGIDSSSLSGDHSSTAGSNSNNTNTSSTLKSSKSRKPESSNVNSGSGSGNNSNNVSSKSPAVSASSSLSTSLPFFFSNPNLLYTPLALSGLNPFSLQAGSLPPTYDSLSLLNGSLSNITSSGSNTTTTSRHKTNTSGSGRSTVVTSSNVTSSSSPSVSGNNQRQSSSRSATPHSQQFQLSTEGHLLDSLTKSRNTNDSALSKSRNREFDQLRNFM